MRYGMVKQPDIGSYLPLPPSGGEGARAVTRRIATGETIGAVMWFDDDMVIALRGGATRAGWRATTDAIGRTVIVLDVLGTHHRWTLTGVTRAHHAAPGRVVHEGIWPD